MLINHSANDKWQRTNRHEGLWVCAGLRDADAVDCEHSHLVKYTFNHLFSVVCGRLVNIKVQLGPSGRANLLPLHQVPWRKQHQHTAESLKNVSAFARRKKKKKKTVQKHLSMMNRVDSKLLFSPGRETSDVNIRCCVCFRGTFNGNSAVKCWRVPCDYGRVLANWCAFDILRRVGHIWRQVTVGNGKRGNMKPRELREGTRMRLIRKVVCGSTFISTVSKTYILSFALSLINYLDYLFVLRSIFD